MTHRTFRRAVAALGCGVVICAAAIGWQTMWWASAWGAFAEDVRDGRVRQGEEVMRAAEGYLGQRPQYVFAWITLAAAMGVAVIVLSTRRTVEGERVEATLTR